MKTAKFYLILLIILIPSRLLAQSQDAGGLNRIVADLEKAFPSVELFVIDNQEDKILVENNNNVNLRPGMEMSLFREGKEFTHPVTGAVLGRFEESLGDIKIQEVRDSYYVARLINLKPDAEIKRGDKVRISSGRIKIAFWKIIDQAEKSSALYDDLFFKLEAGRRFEVISFGQFLTGLEKLAIDRNLTSLDAKQWQLIGQSMGLRAVLLLNLKNLESVNILEARLFSTISGKMIAKSSITIESNITGKQNEK